jgi:hypothetical protein
MLRALQVRGLTKVHVSSEEEALRQFFLGEQARSTAQHALNSSSSRSHVLFTLHIEMRASAEAEERALLSKLHLVDLAGKRTAGAGCCMYREDSRCWMLHVPSSLSICMPRTVCCDAKPVRLSAELM